MFTTRWILAALLLVACALGVGIFTCRVAAAEQKEETKPAKPAETLQALLKARFEVAQKEFDARYQEFEAGRGDPAILSAAGGRLLTAQVELSDKKADSVGAYEDHVRRMQLIEEIMKAKFDTGRATTAELSQAQYYHLDAKIGLARAKGK